MSWNAVEAPSHTSLTKKSAVGASKTSATALATATQPLLPVTITLKGWTPTSSRSTAPEEMPLVWVPSGNVHRYSAPSPLDSVAVTVNDSHPVDSESATAEVGAGFTRMSWNAVAVQASDWLLKPTSTATV